MAGRRGDRRHPPARDAADRHRARRQGRDRPAPRPFRPAEGRAAAGHVAGAGHQALSSSARPPGALHRRVGRGGGRRRCAPGDVAHPREHPLPSRRGEERPGLRRARWPRSAISTSTTPSPPPTAPTPRPRARPSAARLCRPGDGGGAEGARSRARRSRAAGRGGGRRRQGLDQARGARAPGRQGRPSDHRRRHGQHLPRRARRRCRQVAVRARPRRRPPRRSSTRADTRELHRASAL